MMYYVVIGRDMVLLDRVHLQSLGVLCRVWSCVVVFGRNRTAIWRVTA